MLKRILVMAVAAVALSLVPMEAAFAQDEEVSVPDTTASEALGAKGARLMDSLRAALVLDRAYKDRLAAASAEDSLVLRLQIQSNEDAFMLVMAELAAAVPPSGGSQEEQALRAKADAIFPEVTPALWRLIDQLRTEIDALRARRSAIAATERSALEDRIIRRTERLDTVLAYAADHIADLERLGFDTTEERATYAELLKSRAAELTGRIDLGVLRMAEMKLLAKERPGDADVAQLLIATKKNLDANAASLRELVDLMAAMDLPVDTYRAELVTLTQDISSGLLDARTTATLLRRGWDGFVDWLRRSGPVYLVKIILVAAIMFAGWLLARLVRKAVDKSLGKANLSISQLLRRTIVSTAGNVVMAMAAMVALSQFGISLGPLLAGLGVVGFILGFAMQDSLSNFAAGLMILFYRPYDVGDLVEISGVFGKVEHMSMVSTSILTLDNQKLVVPNSKIWGDVIKNVTDQKVRRVDMVFGISYSDDIPHAEKVLEEILAGSERVLANPEPVVRLHTLNESSVDFVVRPWVKTDDYWDVYWEVTRAVKMRFDEERISIPFPQRDVHFYPAQVAGKAAASPPEPLEPTKAQDPDEAAGDAG